jgi:hypothetical protein
MAFTANFMSTSFKMELLKGCHDFTLTTGDVYKLALYDNTPTFTAATTAYTATGEVAASGSYAAGGGTLTNITATTSGTTAYTDFADLTFTTATITAYGCMIYNTTPNTTSSAGLTNPCVATLWFNGAKTSTAGDFTIIFPTADASNAVIRIA